MVFSTLDYQPEFLLARLQKPQRFCGDVRWDRRLHMRIAWIS
jgi:hypothetical protein